MISIAFHTVLPACALAAVYLADYSLIMRASMVDELGQDYLMTARAKGLMDRAIRRGHAVPNASLPTITLIFLNIGFIIGGAITVETVFSYPGLGLLTWNAVQAQDLPLLQALFLLFSVSVIVFNIIADLVIAVDRPEDPAYERRPTLEPPVLRVAAIDRVEASSHCRRRASPRPSPSTAPACSASASCCSSSSWRLLRR